jgi:hypothetical protein
MFTKVCPTACIDPLSTPVRPTLRLRPKHFNPLADRKSSTNSIVVKGGGGSPRTLSKFVKKFFTTFLLPDKIIFNENQF